MIDDWSVRGYGEDRVGSPYYTEPETDEELWDAYNDAEQEARDRAAFRDHNR